MPLYEYRCRGCGHRFEVLQRMGEGESGLLCPRCGEQAPERQLSTFASVGTSSRAEGGGCGSGPGGFT